MKSKNKQSDKKFNNPKNLSNVHLIPRKEKRHPSGWRLKYL